MTVPTNCIFETFQNRANHFTFWSTRRQTSTCSLHTLDMRHKTTNCHFETSQNQAQNGTCWSTQRQTSTRSLRNTTCLFETSQNQTKNVTFPTTSLLLTTVNQFYATPHPRHDKKFSTCDIKPPFVSLTHPKTEPKT